MHLQGMGKYAVQLTGRATLVSPDADTVFLQQVTKKQDTFYSSGERAKLRGKDLEGLRKQADGKRAVAAAPAGCALRAGRWLAGYRAQV